MTALEYLFIFYPRYLYFMSDCFCFQITFRLTKLANIYVLPGPFRVRLRVRVGFL